MLCRHSFYVLRICGVNEFPKKYVLKRWTRNAVTPVKRAVFDARNKLSDGSVRDEIVKDIIGSVEYCVDKLASSIKELAIYRDRLQDLKSKIDAELPNQRPMTDREVISSAIGVSKPSKTHIKNPLQGRRKGDRANSRIIPPKERAMTDGAKKARQCKKCGDQDADHDSRNCTKFQQKKGTCLMFSLVFSVLFCASKLMLSFLHLHNTICASKLSFISNNSLVIV